MVKFGHYLVSHAVPEWASKYVHYKLLKKRIKDIRRALSQLPTDNTADIQLQIEAPSDSDADEEQPESDHPPKGPDPIAQVPPDPTVDGGFLESGKREASSDVFELRRSSGDTVRTTSSSPNGADRGPGAAASSRIVPPGWVSGASPNHPSPHNVRIENIAFQEKEVEPHHSAKRKRDVSPVKDSPARPPEAFNRLAPPPLARQISLVNPERLTSVDSVQSLGFNLPGEELPPFWSSASPERMRMRRPHSQPQSLLFGAAEPPRPPNTQHPPDYATFSSTTLPMPLAPDHRSTGSAPNVSISISRPPAPAGGPAAAGSSSGVPSLPTFENSISPHVPAHREESAFFRQIDLDIAMVNEFFADRLQYFLVHANSMVKRANILRHQDDPGNKHSRKIRLLKNDVRELYRGLELLQNYRVLNYTAFVKAMKKHDKTSTLRHASKSVLSAINCCPFLVDPLLPTLFAKAEELYVAAFGVDSRKTAREQLRSTPRPSPVLTTLRIGILSGMAISLLIVLIFVLSINGDLFTSEQLKSPFPFYRATALLILYLWLWGAVLYAFSQTRINYIFILEANPSTALRYYQVFDAAAFLTFLWFFFFTFYLFCWTYKAPWVPDPEWISFSFFVIVIVIVFCPFNLFYLQTRKFFFRTLRDLVLAPFVPVTFPAFFLGDQMTSATRILLDLCYSFCYFCSPIFLDISSRFCSNFQFYCILSVPFLPNWFRFWQCVRRFRDTGRHSWNPHLLNAGKYFVSMMATMFSVFQDLFRDSFLVIWIVMASIATVYTYSWDILMDWGLFEEGLKYRGLRREIVLSRRWPYYVGIVADSFLRVSWVLTASQNGFGVGFTPDFLLFLLAASEVLRRNTWNFFRMENEHLNNCDNYRAVNFVPLLLDDNDPGGAVPLFSDSPPGVQKPDFQGRDPSRPSNTSRPPEEGAASPDLSGRAQAIDIDHRFEDHRRHDLGSNVHELAIDHEGSFPFHTPSPRALKMADASPPTDGWSRIRSADNGPSCALDQAGRSQWSS